MQQDHGDHARHAVPARMLPASQHYAQPPQVVHKSGEALPMALQNLQAAISFPNERVT